MQSPVAGARCTGELNAPAITEPTGTSNITATKAIDHIAPQGRAVVADVNIFFIYGGRMDFVAFVATEQKLGLLEKYSMIFLI